MTSVPKPLKFLRPHYEELQSLFSAKFPPAQQSQQQETFNLFADILSVLAMTYSDTGRRDTLHYRLLTLGKRTTEDEDPGLWGHEYVRHLAAEISEENDARLAAEYGTDQVSHTEPSNDEEKDGSKPDKHGTVAEETTNKPAHPPATFDQLLQLTLKIVPFFLSHNGEADAVDMLLELEHIEDIEPHIDENTYQRVCTYMIGCVNLLVPPDDSRFLKSARRIYRNQRRFTEAITLAMKLNDMDLIVEDFESAPNACVKQRHLSGSSMTS